jgi:hypothetical protein
MVKTAGQPPIPNDTASPYDSSKFTSSTVPVSTEMDSSTWSDSINAGTGVFTNISVNSLIHLTKASGFANAFRFPFNCGAQKTGNTSNSIGQNEDWILEDRNLSIPWFDLNSEPCLSQWTESGDLNDFTSFTSSDSVLTQGLVDLEKDHDFQLLSSSSSMDYSDQAFLHSNADAGSETCRIVEWLSDPLFLKTKEIWDRLREEADKKAKASASYGHGATSHHQPFTSATSARCLEFFSPSRIRKFLALFWNRWYPHCPIIHKPTFDASLASSTLLTIMILIGAFLSSDREDCIAAAEWLDITEEAIFNDEWLSGAWVDECDELGRSSNMHSQVRALQSAVFLCVLQNWEGGNSAKQKIRRRRFGAVVAVS